MTRNRFWVYKNFYLIKCNHMSVRSVLYVYLTCSVRAATKFAINNSRSGLAWKSMRHTHTHTVSCSNLVVGFIIYCRFCIYSTRWRGGVRSVLSPLYVGQLIFMSFSFSGCACRVWLGSASKLVLINMFFRLTLHLGFRAEIVFIFIIRADPTWTICKFWVMKSILVKTCNTIRKHSTHHSFVSIYSTGESQTSLRSREPYWSKSETFLHTKHP